MKDIDKFKDLLKSFGENFEEGLYDNRIGSSDKVIILNNKFDERIEFRFNKETGKYNGFEANK